jgi:hypothetical protein
MAIVIGSISLDDSYVPTVKVSYEYIRSSSQEVIGGAAVYTVSGRVVVTDGNASSVMSKLQNIREIGRKSECMDVSIPGFYSGPARVTNVNIEQGSDPSWINQGEFSIELKSSLPSLPPNTLGITAADAVTEFSVSEVLEIGEESHSYYYSTGGFSKGFVKFTNKISITCKPFCSASGSPLSKSLALLNRVLKIGPSSLAFNTYASYTKVLQSRTIEINTDGGITFSATMILVPPSSSYPLALVDISFAHNENYQDKSRRFIISGTINGLVNIPWGNPISLGSSSPSSKLGGAESAFGAIKGTFNSFGSWGTGGSRLITGEIPNCPLTSAISSACSSTNNNINTCVEPLNTTVTKSRTEGTINFSFEWGTSQQDNCVNGGKKTEITIDVQNSQPQFVEHVIPRYGTLIQDLNCLSAKRVSYTSSTTTDESSCSSSLDCSSATLDESLDINKYIGGDFLLIGSSISKSRTSYVVKKEYIERCST